MEVDQPYGETARDGAILALGSKNQLKVSKPLMNASWERTAAKLALPDNELSFQDLHFSPSGQTLSALAGTSIFRHLCLYAVREQLAEMNYRPSSLSTPCVTGSTSGSGGPLSPPAESRPAPPPPPPPPHPSSPSSSSSSPSSQCGSSKSERLATSDVFDLFLASSDVRRREGRPPPTPVFDSE